MGLVNQIPCQKSPALGANAKAPLGILALSTFEGAELGRFDMDL